MLAVRERAAEKHPASVPWPGLALETDTKPSLKGSCCCSCIRRKRLPRSGSFGPPLIPPFLHGAERGAPILAAAAANQGLAAQEQLLGVGGLMKPLSPKTYQVCLWVEKQPSGGGGGAEPWAWGCICFLGRGEDALVLCRCVNGGGGGLGLAYTGRTVRLEGMHLKAVRQGGSPYPLGWGPWYF